MSRSGPRRSAKLIADFLLESRRVARVIRRRDRSRSSLPFSAGRILGGASPTTGHMGLSPEDGRVLLTQLFNWAEVAVQPSQGLLDEIIHWGDMVRFVQLQFLVLIRSSQQIEHRLYGCLIRGNRVVFAV